MFSEFFRYFDGPSQGTQFIVDFLKFVFFIALSYNAASGLEPQFVVAADERTDGNGLVQAAVQSDITDTAAVGSSVMRFEGADQLHGFHLWSTRKGTGRERIDKGLDGGCTVVERTAYSADQMDDMAVILHFLVEFHMYVMAVPTEVISGQIHEHDVFGILLRIIFQIFGILRNLKKICISEAGHRFMMLL